MKKTPTPVDIDAARLFTCVDGMRAAWWSITVVPHMSRCAWERICSDGKKPDAIDVDDGPTVGAMLAQVEAAAGEPVDLWTHSRHTEVEYEVDRYDGATLGSGPTRGAALVAAKRALSEAAK